MSEITPEGRVPAEMIPPLDPSLLKLSDVETEFLHATITQDDEELQRRIVGVQKDDMYPYPCIRAFHYVSLMMCGNSIYPLAAGKSGNTRFLDLGCCMGSDVRKLAYDGYPVTNILECDLRQEYIDTGHKLYQDVLTSPIHFFTSNIFDVPVFFTATSTVTHIYTGALFHLFDEATQNAIALGLAVLLKRERGAIIFGRHCGLVKEGMIDDHLGRTRYGHSPTSWHKMWKNLFTEAECAEFAEEKVVINANMVDGDSSIVSARRGTFS
ncbi:hypothetical protein BKA93DRAFT_817900 [Sparassis latifolia]